MKITIDLLFLLKIYLLGCLVSISIGVAVNGFRETKNNFLFTTLISWVSVIYMLKEFTLNKLKNHINTYLYCVLNNYLNGRFSKYYILRDYFNIRYISKHKQATYKKPYFDTYRRGYHRDRYGNVWDTYYDMVEFYFIERYE